MIIFCALFSKLWLEMSGRSPNDVLAEFVRNDMFVVGRTKKESMIRVLNKYIPIAAITGSIFIALISIFADLLGAIGSGTGILLVVNIIYSYFEAFKNQGQRTSKRSTIEF